MVALQAEIGNATRFDLRFYCKTSGRDQEPIARTVYKLTDLRHCPRFIMYRAVHSNLDKTLFKSSNRMDAAAIWVQTCPPANIGDMGWRINEVRSDIFRLAVRALPFSVKCTPIFGIFHPLWEYREHGTLCIRFTYKLFIFSCFSH